MALYLSQNNLASGAGYDALFLSNSSDSGNSSCPDGNKFIFNAFEQCITTPIEWVSFVVGMASIAAWLVVLLPQIYANFKDIRGVSSISWGLLVCWWLGDSTNLVGAFLTNQGIFQVFLGFWFVVTDVIFCVQMIYYQFIVHKEKKAESARPGRMPTPQVILCLMGVMTLAAPLCHLMDQAPATLSAGPNFRHARTLLSVGDEEATPGIFDTTKHTIGYVLGIFSSVSYVCSRSFQIYKNFKERNVTGLQRKTFILCVLGNLLYGAAIFLFSIKGDYLLQHCPWIVGSWGIMMLDSVIVYQITFYRDDFSTIQQASVNIESPYDRDPLLGPANDRGYGSVRAINA